jgi:hypothetical protein
MVHPMMHENQRFAAVKSVAVSGSESASAFWNLLAVANPDTDTDSEADGLRFGFIFEADCGEFSNQKNGS